MGSRRSLLRFSWCAFHFDGHAGLGVCPIFQQIVDLPCRAVKQRLSYAPSVIGVVGGCASRQCGGSDNFDAAILVTPLSSMTTLFSGDLCPRGRVRLGDGYLGLGVRN